MHVLIASPPGVILQRYGRRERLPWRDHRCGLVRTLLDLMPDQPPPAIVDLHGPVAQLVAQLVPGSAPG